MGLANVSITTKRLRFYRLNIPGRLTLTRFPATISPGSVRRPPGWHRPGHGGS
jgi:hypothetical protein